MMRTPHIHAALIKAWADGAQIEVQTNYRGWQKCTSPNWMVVSTYRIKPERVFPVTNLSNQTLVEVYTGIPGISVHSDHAVMNMRRLANAAIKQYILDTEGL